MRNTKPMVMAAAASVCLLFTVAAYGQNEAPEVTAIDAGAAPADVAPTEATTPGTDDAGTAPAVTDETKTPDAPEAEEAAEAAVNPAAENTTEFGKEVWAKYKSREWLPLVGGVLLMLVFVFRKFASKISKFFDTKKGGYIVNFSTAGVVTLSLAFWAGESFSVGLLTGAVGVAIAAGGGYEHARDFLGSLFGGKDDKEADAS